MPVVSPNVQFPSAWKKIPSSVGVIRDGEDIRLWFRSKGEGGGGAILSVEEWVSGGHQIRRRYEKALEQGAWVVGGCAPNRGLVRELVSPLSNVEKSAEVWPSLLDAALPFPLEACSVAFLPPESKPEGGVSCVAAAIRTLDAEEALQEWKELGIHPDLLIPEVLLLSRDKKSRIWSGNHRSIGIVWQEGRFLAAQGGGAKTVARFRTAMENEHSGLALEEVGPQTAVDPDLLERAAAEAVSDANVSAPNLLQAPRETRLGLLVTQKMRTLWCLGAAVIVLGVAIPLVLGGFMNRVQQDLRVQLQEIYRELTGEASPAPGQEVLLAERFLEEEMQEVAAALREVSGPETTTRLQGVLQQIDAGKLILTRLETVPGEVKADVLAEESQLQVLQAALERHGDQVLLTPSSQGTWSVEVRDL